jgi:hypothetical protein
MPFILNVFHGGIKTLFGSKCIQFNGKTKHTVTAEAPLLDQRHIRNSGGHAELRLVILTHAELKDHRWLIELTLTNRDVMGFRMLLGRAAVREHFLVDPGHSYLLSHKPAGIED